MSNLKSSIKKDFGVTGKRVLDAGVIRKEGRYYVSTETGREYPTMYNAVKDAYNHYKGIMQEWEFDFAEVVEEIIKNLNRHSIRR